LKFRIDFGRILPGLIMLITGLFLLAVLVIVAIVAFLFSFLPGWGAAAGEVLEIMLVPVLLIAAGVIIILTGVSWWGKGGEGWLSGIGRARALRDSVDLSSTVGEIIGVAVSAVVFLFLYENQLRGVAFFTSNFGDLAQFFFYAPMFVGMALSLARAIYGHRNAIRPFDAFNALFIAVAAFWLLSVFPFDFTHFRDMFPKSIQFLFGWLNNDIGRVLFAIVGIASLINFVYTSFLYSAVRGQLQISRESQR